MSTTRPGAACVTLRSIRPSDRGAVAAMGRRCSRTTLWHRFLGVVNGLSPAFVDAVVRGSGGQESLVAVLADRRTVVGLATWCPDEAGGGEVGLLVEDAYQRHGIGSRLLVALLNRTTARGGAPVHALVQSDRLHVAGSLLRAVGLTARLHYHGDVTELVAVPNEGGRAVGR